MPDPFEIITKVNMWYQCIIIFPNKKEFVDHLNTLHKKRKEMLSVICAENHSYMNIIIIIIFLINDLLFWAPLFNQKDDDICNICPAPR